MAGYGTLGSSALGDQSLTIPDDITAGDDVLVGDRLTADEIVSGGTSLVNGDFALSAGWGTTATVAVSAGTDQRWRIVVTSSGTGQGATPTITLTFRDGPWPSGARAIIVRNGGTGSTMNPSWSGQPSTTALVITVSGTPVDTFTYAYDCIMIG